MLAESLLRCPVGCNFLWTIVRDRAPLSQALAPAEAFERAAVALHALKPWTDRGEQSPDLALARGARLEPLARAVVAHEASRWWTEPFDSERQILVLSRAPVWKSTTAFKPNARLEDSLQRPIRSHTTATLHGDLSCVDVAMLRHVWEWEVPDNYQRRRAEIGENPAVFEVGSPADWHALCVQAPRPNQASESPTNRVTIVPDWERLAGVYDGVHFSFAGLLTAPFVLEESPAGRTMLWSWDAAFTTWITDVVRPGSLLPLTWPSEAREIRDLATAGSSSMFRSP